MPATYAPVRGIPTWQRSCQISDVEVGDVIDLVHVLGRPARKVQFILATSTDTVSYRLNNYLKLKKTRSVDTQIYGPNNARHEVEVVRITAHSSEFPVYTSEGEIIETADNLQIESVEITALSTSPIVMIVW